MIRRVFLNMMTRRADIEDDAGMLNKLMRTKRDVACHKLTVGLLLFQIPFFVLFIMLLENSYISPNDIRSNTVN